MTLKNQGLLNVRDGDKTAGFKYSTQPAKDAIQRDKEYGPRSALVPAGNFRLTCRSAVYRTERKGRDNTVTKLDRPMIEASWEAFDETGKTYGVFRDTHSLPIQKNDSEDEVKRATGSEKFWSMMGRSFAEFSGPEALEKYLAADAPVCTPAWMEGKSGYARLRVNTARNGSGARFTGIHFFMGQEEFSRNPGPAQGGGAVPAKAASEEPPEVAGESTPEFSDDDIPF